jgi:cation-transporting P-type ATPase I
MIGALRSAASLVGRVAEATAGVAGTTACIAQGAASTVETAAGNAESAVASTADTARSTLQSAALAGASLAPPWAARAARQAAEAVAAAPEGVGRVLSGAQAAFVGRLSAAHEQAAEAADAAQDLVDVGPRRTRRRVWHSGGHAAVEVRGLSGRGDSHRRVAAAVRSAVRGLQGVRWAEVNAVTSQVLIAFDQHELDVQQLVDTVQAVERKHGTDDEDFDWHRPDPSDDAPLTAAYAALAADVAGIATGLAGQVFRFPPLHPALRIPLAALENYPRARGALERSVGLIAADVLLAFGNAAMYGLSEGPARSAVDAGHRLLQVGEVRARREAWAQRCPELCRDEVLPGELRPHRERPRPYPAGPIEIYNDRAAAGSLLAAAGVAAASRDAGRAADIILAGLPRAARFGREGFAAVLGRGLARQGILPMDPAAFRRLDRVSMVVIDSVVLCGRQPLVLSATANGEDGEDGRDRRDVAVWRAASGVLRDLSADDLRAEGPWAARGHKLARAGTRDASASGHRDGIGSSGGGDPGGRPAADSPEGLRLVVTTAGGRRLGEVTVGLELDPLAEAVLGAARASRRRLLITRHASVQELVHRADEVVDGDLAQRVRDLAAAGGGVLLVADGADTDALAAADVAVSCVRSGGPIGWTADLICGPGLTGPWRLLTAAGRARSVSERAVILAVSGSALGMLLAAVGTRRGRGSPAASIGPVHATAALSLIQGAYAGHSAALAVPPAPSPRTAWHAMDAADVVARLDAARAEADAAGDDGVPGNPLLARARQWGEELAGNPVATLLLSPLRAGRELAASTIGELRDPLTPVLMIGAAASAVLGSGVDSALVGSVMAGNALVGGLQRLRTERALHDLLLAEQQEARRVRRDPGAGIPDDPSQAATDIVPASELRPGDVIVLRSDDIVPADARLLVADALEMDESTLTGESMPVSKDPAATFTSQLADRSSMLYEGTTVLAGNALAVVVATGDTTEAGRAGAAAAGAPRQAGVQARLGELTGMALPATGLGGLAVTVLGMLRGAPLREALGAGVAVAVAAVPEGLPLVSTVAQLSAARRLSRLGVLVRSPRTLEALGRVDVLCFDKTGTLTEGRLEVAAAADIDRDLDLGSDRGRELVRVAARACPPPGRRQAHATDQAILEAAAALGEDKGWEVLDEVPFQTSRGYSASLGRADDRLSLAVKGSPEELLGRCSTVQTGRDEEVSTAELTQEGRRDAQAAVDRLAADGLRVLAVAERSFDQAAAEGEPSRAEEVVDDLTLVGFVAIADVIRPDSPEIVEHLANAGIQVMVITGDHPVTASAIARKAGIPDADHVITGADLDQLAEDERRSRVDHCAVFARVSPEQKVRIVADLQRAGHVVAMTGDGTNDAAAIRLADVGIGVAARGSTAARSAADLILSGGDLAQIGDALREGRALWRNVRNALSILLGGNAGEIAFMVIGTAIGGRSPLNTRQLLLVNMLTDMFPALAVALGERNEAGDLGDGPADPLLGAPLGRAIAVRGGATALGATLAWTGGRVTGSRRRAATMGLAAVIATQLGQTLLANSRSPVVIVTSAASVGALVLVVNTPGVSQFFGCTPLGPAAWGIVAASSATGTAASIVVPRLLPAVRA